MGTLRGFVLRSFLYGGPTALPPTALAPLGGIDASGCHSESPPTALTADVR
jgi:hypothetical protein